MSQAASGTPQDAADQPLRIRRLTLTDFRAFPGPAPATFDLDGKNLLVYGENGSGKSSIFHALRGFFSLQPARPLAEHKNVFSGQEASACKVAIDFSNGDEAVEWTTSRHPCIRAGRKPAVASFHHFFSGDTDSRTVSTAQRAGFLDYRALLDTNYKHGSKNGNLFDIAVGQLLRDYPVTIPGGTTSTIGKLWSDVLRYEKQKPGKYANNAHTLKSLLEACVAFNTAFQSALLALAPLINELMSLLSWKHVQLMELSTPGVTYKTAHFKRDRQLQGTTLQPMLKFRGQTLQAPPQLFLNEARLSALGLSIYLAGRLACTPTAPSTALKLMVLDDVVIGLDHSNRLPLLNVLKAKFADWQIVLLTHDRNWFDMARNHLSEDNWACLEIYDGDAKAAAPIPIVYPTESKPARGLLKKARELVNTQFVEAAANYTRQAFEFGMRKACELKRCEIRYKLDPKAHKAQDLLDKLKQWPGSSNVPKADWLAALKDLENRKNLVMNPYSHPSAPNIPKIEVEQAIDAVEHFLNLARKN